jgi:ABC-type sugar transport system substrate-binding protein
MKLVSRRRGGITAALGLLMAGALALAGCAQGGGGAETPGATGGGDAAAVMELANEKVAGYSAFEQVFPELEPFTPGAPGTVDVVTFGNGADVLYLNGQRTVEAFEEVGWNVRGPLDGEFSPVVTGGLIDAAVAENRDAMVFMAGNLQDVPQAVENALDAGVIMVCVMCPFFQELADAGVIFAGVDMEVQGEILAWYLIQQSEASGRLMSLEDPGSYSTVMRADGFDRIVSGNCDSCELLDRLVQPSADIGLPGPPQWSAFLNATPAGGAPLYVNSMADVVGLPMVKTLQSIGRTDVFVGGFDADGEAIDMIRQGDTPFIGTVALPFYWGDWAGVDLTLRAAAGVDLWSSSDLPMQLVTLDNVKDFTEFVPAGDWQAEFKQAWGLG